MAETASAIPSVEVYRPAVSYSGTRATQGKLDRRDGVEVFGDLTLTAELIQNFVDDSHSRSVQRASGRTQQIKLAIQVLDQT